MTPGLILRAAKNQGGVVSDGYYVGPAPFVVMNRR